MVHQVTTIQTPQRIFHQQKVYTALRYKFPEQAIIEGYRFEKQHVPVTQPGSHRVTAAMKQGHANASLIVKSKDIAVRPLHGIDLAHGKILTASGGSVCALDRLWASRLTLRGFVYVLTYVAEHVCGLAHRRFGSHSTVLQRILNISK